MDAARRAGGIAAMALSGPSLHSSFCSLGVTRSQVPDRARSSDPTIGIPFLDRAPVLPSVIDFIYILDCAVC